jgi:hypothetical protein
MLAGDTRSQRGHPTIYESERPMSEQHDSRLSRFVRVTRSCLAGAALSVLLAACGGGSGTDQPAQAAYAFGRISGFGSIVVNRVHYDETSARIQDEDGADHASSELRLGMMVEVRANDSGSNEAAQDITFFSLIRGPVESVAASSLVVLGQTITVNASTVFEDSLAGGLSVVKPGMVVRVFGLLDTSGSYTATRIESSDADSYALLGYITAEDATAKTLNIGKALIDVSAVSLPNGLAVGSLVRVKLQTTKANGAWVATGIKLGARHPHDGDHAEIEGIVTDFTSTKAFSVDGQPVDASNAVFPEGTAGLVKGAQVEVEGSVVNGVLVATKVEVESESEIEAQGFEVRGAIASVNTVNSTFVVHGVTVSFAGDVKFVGGTAMDLQVGAKVEVRGSLASDGMTLNATQIAFEH